MDNTLIVYASGHGTVEKCARQLFHLIDGKVDICNLNKRTSFPDISPYDSIIIGGSIRAGVIQDAITAFCTESLPILKEKRIGLFINCICTGDKALQQLDAAFPEELNQQAVVREYFGGEIENAKLNFWEQIIIQQMMDKESLQLAVSQEKIKSFANKMQEINAE